MEKSRNMMLFSRIASIFVFASLFLPVTAWTQKVADFGKLTFGKYTTTVTVQNRCKQPHDMQIIFSGKKEFGITGLLTFDGGNKIHDVPPKGSKIVIGFLDVTTAEPGEYEDKIKIRCTTCPAEAKCDQDYEEVTYRFTLLASKKDGPKEGEGGPGPGSTPKGVDGTPPQGPIGSTPDEDKKKKKVKCGPDVSAAFEDVLERAARRLRALPAGELKRGFYERNGAQLLIVASPQSGAECPSLGCTNSITLWGYCVSDETPESILQGFVQSMLNMDDKPFPSGREPLDEADRDHVHNHTFGYRLGSQTKTWNDWKPGPEASSMLLLICNICTEKGAFAVDWTKDKWGLADGTYAFPQ